MNDNYFHTDMELIYITESIPGPAEDTLEYEVLLGDYNSQLLDNCMCPKNELCVRMTCTCLQTSHGGNYSREVICNEDLLKHSFSLKPNVFRDYPIIECNSRCLCPATCGNRTVQNGPMEGLIVKLCNAKNKGFGLFTTHFICEGTFVCEYAGELLTKAGALQRITHNEAQGKMNYIFCLNEHTTEGVIQTIVDPSKFGNIGRYINHSCEPNCQVVPVRSEIAIPRLAIFAIGDISPGEEITFSYGGQDMLQGDVAGNYKTGEKGQRKSCLCHSNGCKGFMPFESF